MRTWVDGEGRDDDAAAAGRRREPVAFTDWLGDGGGGAPEAMRPAAPRPSDFLLRRYASAIRCGDDRTATRLRAQLNRLMNGALAPGAPP